MNQQTVQIISDNTIEYNNEIYVKSEHQVVIVEDMLIYDKPYIDYQKYENLEKELAALKKENSRLQRIERRAQKRWLEEEQTVLSSQPTIKKTKKRFEHPTYKHEEGISYEEQLKRVLPILELESGRRSTFRGMIRKGNPQSIKEVTKYLIGRGLVEELDHEEYHVNEEAVRLFNLINIYFSDKKTTGWHNDGISISGMKENKVFFNWTNIRYEREAFVAVKLMDGYKIYKKEDYPHNEPLLIVYYDGHIENINN